MNTAQKAGTAGGAVAGAAISVAADLYSNKIRDPILCCPLKGFMYIIQF